MMQPTGVLLVQGLYMLISDKSLNYHSLKMVYPVQYFLTVLR